MTNKTIGKYEILETLGQGGYGIVYRVMDTTLKIERALKILHPKYQLDPSFIEQFHQVAQLAARLEHAHIVPVYEMNQIGEHVYICMKYMSGGSLKEKLQKNGKLTFEEALEITRQIAEGLEYANQLPERLVHSDINPNNILFEKDDTVRLSDFGFMKALSEVDSLSMNLSGGIVGNPAYTAPEIWDKKESSPASDVYSLACVFYEMITGEVLFSGNMSEVIKKHLIDGAQLPEQWGQDIPNETTPILQKALEREPDKRLQTAAEFVQELEAIAKQKPAPGEGKPKKVTIGKYEILETLGQGGYGTVYRVRDSILNVERALKVLHPVLMSDPTFIERFRKEAQITARLEHPHIVPVYEMDQIGEHIYIAMKYMPGGSLSDQLAQKKRLPFQQALEITRQIAEALEYGYTQAENLIHRDIKPANILFEKDGRARLSDYGFAKLLAEGDSLSLSRSGGIVGTPAYIAPEIWDGKQASPATDVYSLACTFYEMITGAILFEGNTSQVIKKHVVDGAQFPEKWEKDVPEGIEEILKKALTREVEQRYKRIKEFLIGLESLTKKEKPKAEPVIKHPEKKVDQHGIEMVLIPAGSFMMGSNDYSREQPIHEVYLDEYYMDVYQVTNQSYAQFLNEKGNQKEGSENEYWFDESSSFAKIHKKNGVWKIDRGYAKHPVIKVSWYGARAYCKWRGGRLPSEAEWEKAARGGLEGKLYPWGDEAPTCQKGAKNGAQYNECDGGAVAVGSFTANGYGLYDMAGNVWEWVADWHDEDYYGKAKKRNPLGPTTGFYRVLRGGSWIDDPNDLRVADRSRYDPDNAYNDLGFRCASSP